MSTPRLARAPRVWFHEPENAAEAGAKTPETWAAAMFWAEVPAGVVGSMALMVAEPLSPDGQAVDWKVGVVVAALPAAPVAGLRVSPVPVPIWATAACAWVVPSSAPPTSSAPTPATAAVRLSRFRLRVGIPFMEGFLSHFLVMRARRLAYPLGGLPRAGPRSRAGQSPGHLPGH